MSEREDSDVGESEVGSAGEEGLHNEGCQRDGDSTLFRAATPIGAQSRVGGDTPTPRPACAVPPDNVIDVNTNSDCPAASGREPKPRPKCVFKRMLEHP